MGQFPRVEGLSDTRVHALPTTQAVMRGGVEVREVRVRCGTGASDLRASTIDGFWYLVEFQCQIALSGRTVALPLGVRRAYLDEPGRELDLLS